MSQIVEKLFHPTTLDKELFATRWIVIPEDPHTHRISYIQISKDADKPQWVLLGSILECIVEPMLAKHNHIIEILLCEYLKD
jgi:hypothetical protein